MALSNENNYIQSLVSVGNDAHAHLYEVTFDGGFITDVATSMSVRCEGFSPPDQSHESYPVKYVTAWIDRPKTKITVTRNFTLKFRLDDNYILYKRLLEQRKLLANPAHSYARSNILDLRDAGLLFNVKVNIIKEMNDLDTEESEMHEVMRLFNFNDCWIESITAPAYGDSGDPQTVDVVIDFLTMQDWQSGLTGDKDHGYKINDYSGVKDYS